MSRGPLRITLQRPCSAPGRRPGPKSNPARTGLALDNLPPALARRRAWRWDWPDGGPVTFRLVPSLTNPCLLLLRVRNGTLSNSKSLSAPLIQTENRRRHPLRRSEYASLQNLWRRACIPKKNREKRRAVSFGVLKPTPSFR